MTQSRVVRLVTRPWGALPLLAMLGIAVLAGGSRSTIQAAAAPQDQESAAPPTFRSAVQLVEVDVFVTDGDGAFVRDLTAGDFEVLEDGKPHDVRTLALIDIPVEAAPAAPVAGVEPDVTSNRTPPGRIYVILLDSPSTYLLGPQAPRGGLAYTPYTQRVARQFVNDFVTAGDQVAVVHVQGTFNDGQGFTTSRQRMLDAIDRYGRGMAGDAGELTGPEMVARHLDTYRAIQALSERLGAMSGRRKAILWIGGQLTFSPEEFPCPGANDPQQHCAVSRSAPNIYTAYRDALRAASRNNVAVYPVDPLGLTTELGTGEMGRQASLRAVANDTNAFAVVNTNNYSEHYTTIVRENSTYYLLGYAPEVEHRDGDFHSIEVRVKRPGLRVRARRGYQAPDVRASERKAAADAALPPGVSTAARDALRMPVPVTGVSIDVFTAPFKGAGRDTEVVVGGQLQGDLRLDGDARLVVSYQVLATDGKVQTGEFQEYRLDLQPATRARVERSGLRFVDRIALRPGRYELRLVVDQPGAAVGSVITHVDVPDFDERLALSGLVLAASRTVEHVTLRPDDIFQKVLGTAPSAVREYSRRERLGAFVEVYSNRQGLAGSDVAVAAVLTDANGTPITRGAAVPVGEHLGIADRSGRWPFLIAVDLEGLSPGSYILTVEASAAGVERPVRRQVPIRVTDAQ